MAWRPTRALVRTKRGGILRRRDVRDVPAQVTVRARSCFAARLRSLAIVCGMTAIAVALVFANPAAAEASFSAHGSAEQVYATGLPPGAQASLLDPAGQVVVTRNANNLGGLLFRNVTPGDGYRLRLT